MRGFTIESGEVVPVEVTVEDITTDCRDVLHNGQSVCWHEKYKDVFRDLCKNCSSPCEVYSARHRPAFGKLVELKKLDSADAVRFKQRVAAKINELQKVYAQIPSVDCSNCGDCCHTFSIDLYAIEYLQVIEYIRRKFSPADLERIRGLCGMEVAIEKRGLADMRRCPFRDKERKICTINEVKPLVCRHYKCENGERVDSFACGGREENHKMVSSLSDPFLIVRNQEILIFKVNELNRWFLP